MVPQARGAAMTLFASALFLGQTAGVFIVSLLLRPAGTAAVLAGGGLCLLALGGAFAQMRRQRDARRAAEAAGPSSPG
jgi:YNFM family putative membrane transporter